MVRQGHGCITNSGWEKLERKIGHFLQQIDPQIGLKVIY
jgi:hypothetical protein